MTVETERMPWLTIRLIFGNGNAAQGRKCIEGPERVEDETLDVLATGVRKFNREEA